MENGSNGNGKKQSILVAIHKEWQDKGGKVPAGAALDKLKKELRDAYAAEDAAQAALDKARAHRDEVSAKVMQACGAKQPLNLGGEIGVVTPTARGDRAFYKRINQVDTI